MLVDILNSIIILIVQEQSFCSLLNAKMDHILLFVGAGGQALDGSSDG